MILDKTLQIHSAYGRVNNTIKSFKADFNNGLDFHSERGYLSIRDIENILKSGIETMYFGDNKITYIIRFNKIEKWVNHEK